MVFLASTGPGFNTTQTPPEPCLPILKDKLTPILNGFGVTGVIIGLVMAVVVIGTGILLHAIKTANSNLLQLGLDGRSSRAPAEVEV